jgi:hypothetical protein
MESARSGRVVSRQGRLEELGYGATHLKLEASSMLPDPDTRDLRIGADGEHITAHNEKGPCIFTA